MSSGWFTRDQVLFFSFFLFLFIFFGGELLNEEFFFFKGAMVELSLSDCALKRLPDDGIFFPDTSFVIFLFKILFVLACSSSQNIFFFKIQLTIKSSMVPFKLPMTRF